jgi:hypothetical protein
MVPEDQFSLAIGTGGQNVRLASRLTGWSLDFEKVEPGKTTEESDALSEEVTEKSADTKPETVSVEPEVDKPVKAKAKSTDKKVKKAKATKE